MARKKIPDLSAVTLAGMIRSKDVSVTEVMNAYLSQIERINPTINAIVTLDENLALNGATAADKAIKDKRDLGILHGLPIAHKDLFPTKGIRTTFGSQIFSNNIPKRSCLIVDRIQSAGAITIGKTNTPEFGAGSQTYNEVFGETLNPYDITRTCGGSSGGAAAALASRMLPIADGSDTGGSLRNPASFCNVVGFRPSPGRVPSYPDSISWSPLSVEGPMARSVSDCALLLSAIAGPDPRVPISIVEPGSNFLEALDRNFQNVKVAWSQDLGGLPINPLITEVISSQMKIFTDLGCDVNKADPDLSDANEIFLTWRGWARQISQGELLKTHRAQLKETMIWDIEQGIHLSGPDIGQAEVQRTALFQRMHAFMEEYEFLICPVTQVPPFKIENRWVEQINDVPMENFIAWMKSCYYITVTGHPAISIPCGFTSDGLPVGIQIVGRYRDDFGVLQIAKAFEDKTSFWKHPPPVFS